MVHQKTDFPTLLQFLHKLYEEKIPFNRVFNQKVLIAVGTGMYMLG